MKLSNINPIVATAGKAAGEAARWLRSGEYNKVPFPDGASSLERDNFFESNRFESQGKNLPGLNNSYDSKKDGIQSRDTLSDSPSLDSSNLDSSSLAQVLPQILNTILELFTALIGQLTGQSVGESNRNIKPRSFERRESFGNSNRIDTDSSGLRLQTGTLNGEPFVATPFFEIPEGNNSGLSSFDTTF